MGISVRLGEASKGFGLCKMVVERFKEASFFSGLGAVKTLEQFYNSVLYYIFLEGKRNGTCLEQ